MVAIHRIIDTCQLSHERYHSNSFEFDFKLFKKSYQFYILKMAAGK